MKTVTYHGGSDLTRNRDLNELSELKGNEEFTFWLDVGPEDSRSETIELNSLTFINVT